MKLIREIESRKDKKGVSRRWAIFWCDFCKQEVEKSLHKGLRYKSCGCVRYKLIAETNTGKKRTEEQRKNLSKAHTGQKAWNKGIPQTQEAKQKQSETKIKKGIFKGQKNPNFGKKMSEEQINQISETIKEQYKNGRVLSSTIFKSGELSSFWNNGSSFEPYSLEFNKQRKQFILERDNYTCQNPNCEDKHDKLHIHHIDYDKKNSIPENLIALCSSCHMKTNFNRGHFTEFYQNIMINKIVECLL